MKIAVKTLRFYRAIRAEKAPKFMGFKIIDFPEREQRLLEKGLTK